MACCLLGPMPLSKPMLPYWQLETILSEIQIKIPNFLFIKMHLEMTSAKWKPFCLRAVELTHWGRDKMDAVSQTMFSNAFSWMKMHKFGLQFHWSLFLRFQLTIFQHWLRYWLGAIQATSHYLNQWELVYRCIYASLGLNELMPPSSLPSSPNYPFTLSPAHCTGNDHNPQPASFIINEANLLGCHDNNVRLS